MKTQLRLSAAACMAFIAACSSQPVNESMREPASAATTGARVDLDESQQKILSDYFLSSNADVRYIVRPKFSTNADNDYLREQASTAVHEAFTMAFADLAHVSDAGDTSASLGLILGGFKKNMPTAIADNFVKTIKVYKIFGMRVQYDLLFEPTPVDQTSFVPELSSNDLTLLSNRGRLLARLQNSEGQEQIEKVLASARRFKSPDRPYFVGGSVSLNADVLRMLGSNLPSGSPLFKGALTFRRYLVHSKSLGRASKGATSGSVEVTSSGFSAQGETVVSTVDFVYSFDKKDPAPKLNRVDVFPGQIVAVNDLNSTKKTPVVQKTGFYEVSGKKGKKDFTIRVEKISLDGSSRAVLDKETEFDMTQGSAGLFGISENAIRAELLKLAPFAPVTSELVEKGDVL